MSNTENLFEGEHEDGSFGIPKDPKEAEKAERKLLLSRAKTMGLRVSPNIGLENLRKRIAEHLAGEQQKEAAEAEEEAAAGPAVFQQKVPKKLTLAEKRNKLRKQAMVLRRIRITCLNPDKKDLPGEFFTVGNRYIGTVTKYVPFGDPTENGYHVPDVIYQFLKNRKFAHKIEKKDGSVTIQDVPEFAIELLPSLTHKELNQLKQRQAMASGASQEE